MFKTLVLHCGRANRFSPLTVKKPLLVIPAKIQTDGSFINGKISRTAVILTKSDGVKYSLVNTYFDHKNLHESEWRSVVDALEYTIKKEEHSVLLENANFGVINNLVNRNKPPGLYIYYYDYIFEMLGNFDFLAVRWIPRALNKADKLFR